MKTRLHTADVLTFTLTGAEPQRALTLAALAAEGESRITGLRHIDRGYEALEQDLAALGADIRRETL